MLAENTTAVPGPAPAETPTAGTRPALAWLTGEVALYILLGLLALALRLMALGQRPLDSAEAQQAFAAWQVANRQGPQAVGFSPLLLLGNLVTFLLPGASDFAARLAPAIFGTFLALMPAAFRRWLGRPGALAATAILAFSPTVLYYSRYLSSEILVASCVLLTVAGLMHFIDGGRAGGLKAAAAGLGLLLAAGPGAYSFLAVALTWAALLAVASRLGYARGEWRQMAQAWKDFRSRPGLGGQLALIFFLTVLLVATACLFNFPGFQSAIDQFSLWTAQMGPAGNGLPWYQHLLLLVVYEPLILVFGIVGLIAAFSLRNMLASFLAYWAVLVLYAYTLFGGKSSGDLLLALVPLALLAGLAIGKLWEAVQRDGSWEVEGLFFAITAPIIVYSALQVTGFVQIEQSPHLFLMGAGMLLVGVLFIGYLFWVGPAAALRSLGVTLVIMLALFVWGTGWRLNFVNLADPREVMVREPANFNVRDLFSTVERLSVWRSGDPRELPLNIVGQADPILKWYSRDFRTVRYSDAPIGDMGQMLYITAEPAGTSPPAGVGPEYRGQRFALTNRWPLSSLQGTDWINWWLYRRAPSPARNEGVVLWARDGGKPGYE